MSTELHTLGRLRKRSEFLYVRDGKFQAIGGIVIQMRDNSQNQGLIRVGFTATRKIGNAVIRNRAKRRLREVAQALLPKMGQAGHDYVFIARQSTPTRPYDKLLKDAERALLKLS